MTRLEKYLAAYRERWGVEPTSTPDFVPTQREHP
jgi:hypothetical protein